MLTEKEIEKIQRIFFQIQPSTVKSIQNYNPFYEFRQYIIVGIQIAKYKSYDVLYINIENITPWQLTIFDKRAKKELPGKAFTEQHGTVTRLGFK